LAIFFIFSFFFFLHPPLCCFFCTVADLPPLHITPLTTHGQFLSSLYDEPKPPSSGFLRKNPVSQSPFQTQVDPPLSSAQLLVYPTRRSISPNLDPPFFSFFDSTVRHLFASIPWHFLFECNSHHYVLFSFFPLSPFSTFNNLTPPHPPSIGSVEVQISLYFKLPQFFFLSPPPIVPWLTKWSERTG